MINCVIIDDEPLGIELLQGYVDREPDLRLLRSFTDAKAAVDFIRANKVDLLFLDIQMPYISGIDLLKSLDPAPLVIFTTAFSEYAVEGFELEAMDYLLKPYSRARFQRAVAKVREYLKSLSKQEAAVDQYIFVKSEYMVIKINLADIRYIEGLDDYIKIHTTTARPVLTLMPLKTIMEKLPQDQFARVHRSFIVSFSKIDHIANKRIRIGDISIPIGDTYADNVSRLMKRSE